MRTHLSLREVGLCCAASAVLLIGVQLGTQGWPYSWRLMSASAAIGLTPLIFLRAIASRPLDPTCRRQPGLHLPALSLLIGLGLWLAMTWLELSAYFGYPVLPLPEAPPTTPWEALRLLAAVAVLAPLGTEALFRGVVQRACEPLGQRAALAIGTLSFAAYHLYAGHIWGLCPLLLLGLTLGYVAWRSRSIVASTLVHATVNGLAAAVFVLNGLRPGWVAGLPVTSPWSAAVGAVVGGLGLWLYTRATSERRSGAERSARPRRVRRGSAGLIVVLAAAAVYLATGTMPPAPPPSQLTAQQKEAEFRYLTRLIRETYAVSDAIAQVKGLEDPVTLEDDYIRRAAATKDDWEYYQVFREYLVRLGQGGHAYVLSPQGARCYSPWYLSYDFGLYPSLLTRADYWWPMEDRIDTAWYAHSQLDILYQDGRYVLAEPAVVQGRELPVGTVIERVDGLEVDEYARLQQARDQLYYDPYHHKVFLNWAGQKLLLVNPGRGRDGWQVDLRLPDGRELQGLVRKVPGRDWAPLNVPHVNVITAELSGEVGYVRVFSFIFTPYDHAEIQGFMQRSGGRYHKLIIDVRGNGGGDPRYWMDSLVAPLLKRPVTYEVLSAVRRGTFDRLNIRFWLHRAGGIAMFGRQEHFKSIAEVAPPAGFDPRQWRAFRVQREIKPAGSVPFDGQVYVLADEGCASACADYVLALKTTGLARIIGAHTHGSAPGVFPAMPYTLPESGISFMLEACLAFNPDGTICQVDGTEPDVPLCPVLPPESHDRQALLEDPWVQWVLGDDQEVTRRVRGAEDARQPCGLPGRPWARRPGL